MPSTQSLTTIKARLDLAHHLFSELRRNLHTNASKLNAMMNFLEREGNTPDNLFLVENLVYVQDGTAIHRANTGNISNLISDSIEEVNSILRTDPSTEESVFSSFVECINDPGINLRDLRRSLVRVTAADVDPDTLDDFDLALHCIVDQLRNA